MNLVKMIQITKYEWKIVSQSGNMIQKDIYVNNVPDALQYIKTYVSSFNNWHYEIIPLPRKDTHDGRNDS